jgi:NADH-quinone oxidoreductase subunit M
MNISDLPILSIVTFFPLVGAFVLLLAPRSNERYIKIVAAIISAIDFLLSLVLFFNFDSGATHYQFIEKLDWIPAWGIQYYKGIDGISLMLIMLTTFLTPLAIWSSFNFIQERRKEFYIVMLLEETGMLGVFVSLDLFLFYMYWEVMLLPMFLLIGVWGGPRRIYAAVKFFLYTLVGSVLMLVGILVLYFQYKNATGSYTMDLTKLAELNLPLNLQLWLFAAFALAFCIKIPMFPFHTWLPDAHVEAPTAGSVDLAAILLKIGTYGFIRLCIPLFPLAFEKFIFPLTVLALIGIIYGAWVSVVQTDVKKLVAYSSVSHMGFIVLGFLSFNMQGLQGGLIQMVNHGLSTGALFLIVGMLYERRHTRMIGDYGGIAKTMPILSSLFMIVMLSSVGLPGTNGFVGEFLILVGAFRANWWAAAVAALGIIFAAVYLLWMFQRVIFGKIENPKNTGLKDISPREIGILIPIIIFIFWIGFYPSTFLSKSEKTFDVLIQNIKAKQTQQMVIK